MPACCEKVTHAFLWEVIDTERINRRCGMKLLVKPYNMLDSFMNHTLTALHVDRSCLEETHDDKDKRSVKTIRLREGSKFTKAVNLACYSRRKTRRLEYVCEMSKKNQTASMK